MREYAFLIFFVITFTGTICNYTPQGKRYNNVLYWAIGGILILFAGLREIGIDHDSVAYRNYYDMGKEIWIMAEPTFGIISRLVKYIFNNFQYVIIIYAIAGITLKFKAINRLTELQWLSLIVYFSTYFLLHEFTQIRAGIASGLVLLSIPHIAERKPWHFLGFVGLAMLFHYSAIIALPLYLLTDSHLNRAWKILIGSLIPIGIVLHYLKFDPLLFVIPIETIRLKIEIYQQNQESTNISLNIFNLVYIVKYIILYILLFYYETIYNKAKYISLLLKIYALSLFAYTALSSNTIIAMRISELLGVVEMILIPYLYYLIKPKWAGAALVVFIAFVYLIINIYSLELIYATPKLS